MADTALTASIYDPIFYAQQAILALEKRLGMAGRIYRGYDRNPQERGSVIQIRRPGTFEAKDAPGSGSQDINASMISITLNKWKEVTFSLTDKELSLTIPQLIDEHIRPAAYALALAIDNDLTGLYKEIPWYTGTAGSTPDGIDDFTNCYQILFDNLAPVGDPTMLHMMINGAAQNKFQQLAAFNQVSGAGDMALQMQLYGTLGVKYGFETSATQNLKTHTKGTLATSGTVAVDASTLTDTKVKKADYLDNNSFNIKVDASTSMTGTVTAGDIVKITGHTQQYTVLANATASANAIDLTLGPTLEKDIDNNTVVEFVLQDGVRNLAFHRDFAALAMAPLSEMGNGLGAQIAAVTDPVSNLSLRSRLWYEGGKSRVFVSLDCLYGYRVLQPNLAVQLLG